MSWVKELWAIALTYFEKLRMAKLICLPPPLFGIKFKKKSFFYYISMQAYIVQIANGIRVCFETLVTVLLPPNPVMEIFTQAF